MSFCAACLVEPWSSPHFGDPRKREFSGSICSDALYQGTTFSPCYGASPTKCLSRDNSQQCMVLFRQGGKKKPAGKSHHETAAALVWLNYFFTRSPLSSLSSIGPRFSFSSCGWILA